MSELLNRCNRFYSALAKGVERRLESSNPENVLKWVEIAAGFAWIAGVGVYADGRLENAAYKVGSILDHLHNSNSVKDGSYLSILPRTTRFRILHVATKIYITGGHGRLINNFIRNDPKTSHSLIVTNQGNTTFPTWLSETISTNGGVVIQLPSEAMSLSKAKWLRDAACSGADAVILHHHPNDPIPIVALAAQDCPPTALMNHADHVFWLGSSVADIVVNIRQSGLQLSKTRRSSRHNCLLPIPLSAPTQTLTKENARQKLGIPSDELMLLSIGTAYKYQPTQTHNFFRSAMRILSKYPKANLYLIGVQKRQIENFCGCCQERVHLLGEIEDVRPYYSAADLYLEGFPFGSMTAFLDAVAAGVCSVLSLISASPLMGTDDPAVDGMLEHSKTEDEYVALVGNLIESKEQRERIVALVKDRVLTFHCYDKWEGYLKHLYDFLTSHPHTPAPIPEGSFMATPDDVVWNAFASRGCHETILAQRLAIQYLPELGLSDLLKLFAMSINTGDTPLTYSSLRSWPWIFKKKFFTGTVYASDC